MRIRPFFMLIPAATALLYAVHAYLESLPSDGDAVKAAPFTVVYQLSDTPNGDPEAGEATYNRACASCHGAAHTGVGRLVPRAPPLPEQTLIEHPLPRYTALEKVVATGRRVSRSPSRTPSSGMPRRSSDSGRRRPPSVHRRGISRTRSRRRRRRQRRRRRGSS